MSRLAAAAVVALLIVTLPGVPASALVPGGSFIDDNESIHESDIEAIAQLGITRGCDPPANDHFCPEDVVTRGTMAAFLRRALDLPPGPDVFVDDDGTRFESDINAIARAGITLGCNPPANDRFCPDRAITRGQMAAMLDRAFLGGDDVAPASFIDIADSPFVSHIDAIAAAGITKGCDPPKNERFCPDGYVTRQQMASFLTRALDLDPIMSPHPLEGLDHVSREGWGASEPERGLMEPHRVVQLTVHHAGVQSEVTGPEQFRTWEAWHRQRGWGDLAYHVIIGVDGTVYEARDIRFAGDTGTNYDPAGHFLVVLEGNFEIDRPTEAQIDSLVTVLAWAADLYDVDPATLSGHRDHAATACPGEHLYELIHSGELEQLVLERMSSS